MEVENNNALKKIFTSILLIFLLLQSAGMLFLFFYSQYVHKREVRNLLAQNIPIENFELVRIPLYQHAVNCGSFKMIESDEFIFNGKLFDVFSKEIKSDTVYFYCLHDDKEEALFSKLGNYFNNNRINSQIPGINDLSQLINVLVTFYPSKNFGDHHFENPKNCYFTSQLSRYLSIVLDSNFPPPRMNLA